MTNKNFAIKIIKSGRLLKGGLTFASKAEAKSFRDDLNQEHGSIKFCVTRTETNLKSDKPHYRSHSEGTLHVF